MKLTVAIPTFRRPERLEKLLVALPTFISEVANLAEIDVLVIDNDPARSGEATAYASQCPKLSYVCEPTPGISAARNRAMDESGASRLLAFIDDDEFPRSGWLRELVLTWHKFGSSAVAGHVVSVYDGVLDPWILAGGYFQRPTFPTGTQVKVAATNNLLLDLQDIRKRGVRFDETLGLGGGEDSLFTSELVHNGGSIVWCKESVVEDPIPHDRATRAWVTRRAYSHGHGYVTVALKLTRSRHEKAIQRMRWMGTGAGRWGVGIVRNAFGLITGDLRHEVRGHRGIQRGRGMIRAALGRDFSEYERSTNRPSSANDANDSETDAGATYRGLAPKSYTRENFRKSSNGSE